MQLFVVCSAALLASLLTLFSGFGLGTLLLPVLALFFPVPVAIALTAVVHLLNNLFKLLLLGKFAKRQVVALFGVPALLGALVGASLLLALAQLPVLVTYRFLGVQRGILPVKVAVALLMIGFVFLEMLPRFRNLAFQPRYLPLGGSLSGFFGGLSGHQGALRSAFLINCGLSKEEFLGTGVVIACLVDGARIAVYGSRFASAGIGENGVLLVAATLSAFFGAWLGSRFLHKVTVQAIQLLIATLLFGIAVGLATGIL